MSKKLTTEQFIAKANDVHNNKYTYNKTNYINSRTKVIITCPKHGDFEQTPANHLYGKGCPKCSGKFKTTEEWIIEAKEIHGDKYDYSKTVFINTNTKVCIICPKHGEFWQLPYNHLSGEGCSKCRYDQVSLKNKSNLETFITKAQEIHDNKYDYSKATYVLNNVKTTIICPIHGEFKQTPQAHLSGEGCPMCQTSKGELTIEKYLKHNNIQYIHQYPVKIDESINPSGLMYIDFYLPQYNLFIEYNGRQHYVPVNIFGGELFLQKQQKRDAYVREYCKINKIKLLEIKYTQDNIEQLIDNCLFIR